MKFAYADPPYPRQAKRLYGSHPDFAGMSTANCDNREGS